MFCVYMYVRGERFRIVNVSSARHTSAFLFPGDNLSKYQWTHQTIHVYALIL